MPYDLSTPEGRAKAQVIRKRWYEANRAKHIAGVRKVKQERQVWLREIKSKLKCKNCGEDHPSCLDFHHKNGLVKEANISQMPNRGASKEKILQEIEKCEVLCSNCHRKLHYMQDSID